MSATQSANSESRAAALKFIPGRDWDAVKQGRAKAQCSRVAQSEVILNAAAGPLCHLDGDRGSVGTNEDAHHIGPRSAQLFHFLQADSFREWLGTAPRLRDGRAEGGALYTETPGVGSVKAKPKAPHVSRFLTANQVGNQLPIGLGGVGRKGSLQDRDPADRPVNGKLDCQHHVCRTRNSCALLHVVNCCQRVHDLTERRQWLGERSRLALLLKRAARAPRRHQGSRVEGARNGGHEERKSKSRKVCHSSKLGGAFELGNRRRRSSRSSKRLR